MEEPAGRRLDPNVEDFIIKCEDLAVNTIPGRSIICVIVKADGKIDGTLYTLDTRDEVPVILRKVADRMEGAK